MHPAKDKITDNAKAFKSMHEIACISVRAKPCLLLAKLLIHSSYTLGHKAKKFRMDSNLHNVATRACCSEFEGFRSLLPDISYDDTRTSHLRPLCWMVSPLSFLP